MSQFRHLSLGRFATPRTLRIIVSVVVTLGLTYVLYRQLFVDENAADLLLGFRQNFLRRPHWVELALVVLLMPINLLLEGYKLRMGMPTELRPSLRRATRQVCSGITVGLWTPGRVGEFGGRLVETESHRHRAYVLASTTIGGLAQWVPVLTVGGGATLWWRGHFLAGTQIGHSDIAQSLMAALASPWTTAAAYAALGVASLICVGFWRKRQLLRLAARYWPSRWRRLPVREIAEVRTGRLLLASGLRYGVYLVQLSLAFRCFGLDLDLITILGGTAALFLLHSILPLPPALQALARVELALLVFAFAKPNELVILAASAFIFALNLGLPALLGWWFIVRRNVQTP